MDVVLRVQRQGEQYQGSVTRVSDRLCVPFVGVLELIAALERLDPEPPTGSDAGCSDGRKS